MISPYPESDIESPNLGSALGRAEQIQRYAAQLGFDWERIEGVLAKIEEEISECRAVLSEDAGSQARQHELGDLLFSCVNLARHLGIDPEQALHAANRRFAQRLAEVERRLRAQGLQPGAETRALMELYWDEVKTAERA